MGVMTGIHGALQAIAMGCWCCFCCRRYGKPAAEALGGEKPETRFKVVHPALRLPRARWTYGLEFDAGGVLHRAGHGVYHHHPIGQFRHEQRIAAAGVD